VAQTYTNLEILVSDNGSSNIDVHKIIKEFASEDKRVKFFLHKQNKGAFFNFRFLLEQASGEYFIWLADDDYWCKNFLTNITQAAKEHRAALTYGRAIVVDVNISDSDAQIKEMNSAPCPWLSVPNFLSFDTDSIIYGMFRTEVGKKLTPLLKDWSFSKKTRTYFPFLTYNFPSYPFIFGLLLSGGFYNASSGDTTHFVGGRPPYAQQPFLNVKHLTLLNAYLSMHVQMVWRCIFASSCIGSLVGLLSAPFVGGYFFLRRIYVALINRKKRSITQA
jgi:glycosyltransferase involved in cell wall biosynthesis